MGLPSAVWERLKKLSIVPRPAPDKKSVHRNSILDKQPRQPRRKIAAHTKGKAATTNNQRVVIGRAARLGISVRDYEIKFKGK